MRPARSEPAACRRSRLPDSNPVANSDLPAANHQDGHSATAERRDRHGHARASLPNSSFPFTDPPAHFDLDPAGTMGDHAAPHEQLHADAATDYAVGD